MTSIPTTKIKTITKLAATRKRIIIAWAFLLPNFLGFAIFTAGPVLFSLYMAFTDWSLVKHNDMTGNKPTILGFENFQRILYGDESRLFWDSMGNTVYLMIGIPIGIAGSLIVALLLNRQIGPKRKTTRATSALLALVVGITTAAAAYLITHPGPIPTPADVQSILTIEGQPPTPPAVNQFIQSHELDLRASNSISALFLILGIVVASGLALGVVFFRTLFYLPSLLAGIALFLLWKSLYKPTGGAINQGLTPILNTLQATVTNTPTTLWYTMGYATWILTIILTLYLLIITLRKLIERDFSFGAGLGSTLAILSITAVGLGLGYLLCQLPAEARFITSYAPLTTDTINTIHQQFVNAHLPIDPTEIEILFNTLGDSFKPNTLIDATTALLPLNETATTQTNISQLVMQHAQPLHEGLTAGPGLQPPKWLVDETWAKPALILMGVWTAVGGANMLLYLAGLSNVPEELYEAAHIDGATPWQRFWNVTWPQLAPTTFFIVIMSTIGGLQGGFDQARAMTSGKYGTEVVTYYLYKLAFTDEFQLGLASAVAWVVFAMIFAMTIINYRFGNQMLND